MTSLSKNYSQVLPKCVVKYKTRGQIQKQFIGPEDECTRNEKALRDWFKCPQILLQCYYTSVDFKKFQYHLKKHNIQKFLCIYCKFQPNDKQIKELMNANKLVTHMIEVHRHRRYQCNLCLYRAITPEHVNIHQSIIHSNIHKETIINKQLNGKSCKIIECPPVTPTSANKPVPTALEFFKCHKHLRLNNDETHNKNYQCVYCDYMNENLQRVVEHCVQTHPDYTVLYYLPEPLVTSTLSPSRQQQFQEFDMFDNNPDAQDNRVTSTECEPAEAWAQTKKQCDKYVAENAFVKKQRVSAVQTSKPGQSNCGLSNKNLNKDSYPTNSAIRRPNGIRSMLPTKVTKSGNWRPNQMAAGRKPMPKSKKDELKKQMFVRTAKRGYQSDDSSDETPVKKVAKPTPKPDDSSVLAFISPKKDKIDKKMVCLVCVGNDKHLTESTVGSHILSFHKNKCKPNGNRIPYMCPFCKNFFDVETDSTVTVHQMKGCSKMPEDSERGADFMIISAVEFHKRKEQRLEEENSRKQRESNKKLKLKQKSRPKIVHLSDNDYEELETESAQKKRAVESPPKLKKQSSIETQSKSKVKTSLANRFDECSGSQYFQDVVDSSDEFEPQPSTSTSGQSTATAKVTTTITPADDSDEMSTELMVCLFCDHRFDNKRQILKHFESHLPELSDATLEHNRIYSIRNWINRFVDKQSNLIETQHLSDDVEWDYKCPICVRVCQMKHLRPKQFKTFWELRVHFWEHTLWTPVKCLICTSGHPMANCDHLIAKHFNTKHHTELNSSSDKFIRQLVGNKVKTFFTPEQKQALLTHKFIEFDSYQPVEQLIESTLKQISDRHESYLRQQAYNENKLKVILPKISLKRLPQLNFDDEEMVSTYIKNERKPGKVMDVICIGSSSLDSDDEEEPIPVRKANKKPNTIIDSDEEEVFKAPNSATNSSKQESSQIEMNVRSAASPQRSSMISPQMSPSSPIKRFECSQCHDTFENRKDVKNHCEEAHPGLPITFHRI